MHDGENRMITDWQITFSKCYIYTYRNLFTGLTFNLHNQQVKKKLSLIYDDVCN